MTNREHYDRALPSAYTLRDGERWAETGGYPPIASGSEAGIEPRAYYKKWYALPHPHHMPEQIEQQGAGIIRREVELL